MPIDKGYKLHRWIWQAKDILQEMQLKPVEDKPDKAQPAEELERFLHSMRVLRKLELTLLEDRGYKKFKLNLVLGNKVFGFIKPLKA